MDGVSGGARDALVVGVAICRGGRLLAARRTTPAAHAGRWELPGGKAAPGEDLAAAAVREVAEELGCRVVVEDSVPGEVEVGPGLVLRVVVARLEGEAEPLPLEHDALRWLAADQLDEVDWLEADRPFVAALRERWDR